MRKGATESTAIVRTLNAGTRLFVLGDPKVGGKLLWHHVAVIGKAICTVRCNDMGWVATPTTGPAAWIKEATIACPPSPTTAEALATLLPLERVHCYGDRDLTVTGWIDTPCCSGGDPMTISPAWLAAEPSPFFFRTSADDALQVHFPLAAGLQLPKTTVIIRATAHFNDPAAATCAAAIAEGAGDRFDPADLPPRERMVVYCRANLVITEYEVVGYRPPFGPGCGCLPPSPRPAA